MSAVERYGQQLGETLADAGVQLALSVVEQDGWVESARAAIEDLAASCLEFDADSVRWRAGSPPSPATMGAVFREAHQRGLIEVSGYRTATRLQRHGSLVRVWRGKR